MTSSVVADEIARFGALADRWWDPRGPMAPLHAMNPLRTEWADRQTRAAHGGAVRLLDVGCGAGLVAEAMARRGHDVLGIDAAKEGIAAAEAHAAQALAGGQGLPVAYRVASTETLLEESERFPAITALEVIEHVADPEEFVCMLAELLLPGGVVVLSTVNRTRRSFLTAKFGAEYVLRLLPVGTHNWRQFIPPENLARMLRQAGLRVSGQAGMSFNPFRGQWRESRDLSVNYLMAARKD
jgi:2-polyprenyl-6-hydroxyphenyl methylase/3-demethylubiquinone-9 3-methyltransferase